MYRCNYSLKGHSSDIAEQKNTGCLQITANKIGENITVKVEKINDPELIKIRAWKVGGKLYVTQRSLVDKKLPIEMYAHKIGSKLSVSTNIIYSIGNVDIDYVPFLVKEGEFILVDGQIFNVKSYGVQQ